MKFNINLKNKKILKKVLAFALPFFVVGASITTYIIKTNNKTNIVNNNIEIKNGIKRIVYLSSNDNLLTPITVTIEKEELLNDEIIKLVNLLKEDSKAIKGSFKGLLSKDCELNNVEINEDEVTLNFNENFNTYDEKIEKRIIESLVWTTLQYDY